MWTLNKLTNWQFLFRRTIFSPTMTIHNNNNNNNNKLHCVLKPFQGIMDVVGGGWGGWLVPGFVYRTWHLSWCGPQRAGLNAILMPRVSVVLIYTIVQYPNTFVILTIYCTSVKMQCDNLKYHRLCHLEKIRVVPEKFSHLGFGLAVGRSGYPPTYRQKPTCRHTDKSRHTDYPTKAEFCM